MSPAPTGEGAVRDLAQASERTITVTSTDILRSGFNGRKKWTLFAIKANDDQGQPITDDLRSFQRLNGTITCTFEPYEAGVWTLREVTTAEQVRERRNAAREKLVGTPAGASSERADTGELAELRRRVDDLENRFSAFAALMGASA